MKRNNNSNIYVINKNNYFRRIYKQGEYFVSPLVVTYVMKNKGTRIYCGMTASKKVGNAVKRNRARRVIKAHLPEIMPNIKSGVSIVFVARAKTPYAKSHDVARDIKLHLKKAGVWAGNGICTGSSDI